MRLSASLVTLSMVACGPQDSLLTNDTDTDTAVQEDGLDEYQVTVVTTLGEFTLQLDWENAPITVDNFMAYASSGFFDGDDGLGATTFHRIIDNFMIQGGGYTADGVKKQTLDPIINEGDNGLSNLRGTIAMARTSDPESATSQFYINHVDNTYLDYGGPSAPGYAVFGSVIAGLDVVDIIATVATNANDEPTEQPIVIEDLVTWLDQP